MAFKLVDGVEVPLTQEEIDDFDAREAAHSAAQIEYAKVAYKDRRQEKYNKRGVTPQAMSVALWEKVIEDRPEAADALQVIRLQVKSEEPKPV